jgi:hypothetical protein
MKVAGRAQPRRSTISLALIGVVVVLAVLVGVVVYEVRHEHASTACGFTPPGREAVPPSTVGWHVDWEWWTPEFVCVYTDANGNAVARRRP